MRDLDVSPSLLWVFKSTPLTKLVYFSVRLESFDETLDFLGALILQTLVVLRGSVRFERLQKRGPRLKRPVIISFWVPGARASDLNRCSMFLDLAKFCVAVLRHLPLQTDILDLAPHRSLSSMTSSPRLHCIRPCRPNVELLRWKCLIQLRDTSGG